MLGCLSWGFLPFRCFSSGAAILAQAVHLLPLFLLLGLFRLPFSSLLAKFHIHFIQSDHLILKWKVSEFRRQLLQKLSHK